jgi:hypothetical protein
VYLLLGIFNVRISLYYGEGTASTLKQLKEEIKKLNTYIKDLHLTDPYNNKKRIKETKGGLLEDSYHWILKNPDF